MPAKCPECHLVNFSTAPVCVRCGLALDGSSANDRTGAAILRRAVICLVICVAVIVGFYVSLIASANSLAFQEKQTVHHAIMILREHGFSSEAFLLDDLTAFRGNDNWLNASVAKENAYAATNFPFEIVTLYPDFFAYPIDDTERAAILLHESKHMQGKNEHDAYEFVWSHRKELGWTRQKYAISPVWQNIRKQRTGAVRMRSKRLQRLYRIAAKLMPRSA